MFDAQYVLLNQPQSLTTVCGLCEPCTNRKLSDFIKKKKSFVCRIAVCLLREKVVYPETLHVVLYCSFKGVLFSQTFCVLPFLAAVCVPESNWLIKNV